MTNFLISGDPLDPSSGDLIAQTDTLEVGKPVPAGWRVMTGGQSWSQIARVAMRYEVEADNYVEEIFRIVSDAGPDTDIDADNDRAGRKLFAAATVGIGETLTFKDMPHVTATTVSENRISFEGEITSLSAAALIVINRNGKNWSKVNGWLFWTFNGETMIDRKRLTKERAE